METKSARSGRGLLPRHRLGNILIFAACLMEVSIVLALIVTGAIRLWLPLVPVPIFVLGVLLTLGARL